MHLLGIDVAKDSLVCCLIDRHGNELQHFRVANSRKGLAALRRRLKQPTRVFFESTGVYSKLLLAELDGKVDGLHQLSYKLASAGNLSMSRTKTDEHDARCLARAGLILLQCAPDKLRTSHVQWRDDRESLELLVSEHCRLSDELVRRRNRINSLEAHPASAARLLQQRLRAEIEQLEASQKEVHAMVAQAVKGNEDVKLLKSIPGIGVLTAAAIWAKAGDVSRYDSADAFKCKLGVYPRRCQTGNHEARTRMAKHANRNLKHLMWNCAKSAARHNPICKREFERIIAKGKHAAAAFGAVSTQLIQTAYGVLRNRTPFNPNIGATT
jgi:transposase